jgi:hypothetical protein
MDPPTRLDLTTENPGSGHRLVISMRFGVVTAAGAEKFHKLYDGKFEVNC